MIWISLNQMGVDRIRRTAKFSPDRKHRILLSRIWDVSKPNVLFIGMNPSLADAERDDQTIRKEIGFATRNQFGGFIKLNLFTYITPYPDEMLRQRDPELVFNVHLFRKLQYKYQIICCWGNVSPRTLSQSRLYQYLKSRSFELNFKCFGITNQGQPLHTLRLPYSKQLQLLRRDKEIGWTVRA